MRPLCIWIALLFLLPAVSSPAQAAAFSGGTGFPSGKYISAGRSDFTPGGQVAAGGSDFTSGRQDTAKAANAVFGGISFYNEKRWNVSDEAGWIEKGLPASVGGSAEWYAMVLLRMGAGGDFTPYIRALEQYLAQKTVFGATDRQKYALTLAACGIKGSAFVSETVDATFLKQGVMSVIFGLHLLNNGCAAERITREQAADCLLSIRTPDGGWAVTGSFADTDVTAMALQALAPLVPENEAVREAANQAVVLLSGMQLDSGGFQSYGQENPESAAQVMLALTALGIDPVTDSRFAPNGHTLLEAMCRFRLENGSFSHTAGGKSNETATVQVYMALAALQLFNEGRGSFYLFDERPFVPDETQAEAPGETQAEDSGETRADSSRPGKKAIVLAVLGGVSLVLTGILWACGKRKLKNLLAVGILFVAGCALIFTIDIQSPEAYYNGRDAVKAAPCGTVTMTIRCDTVAGKTGSRAIPEDGVILPVTDFPIEPGDTVFDILVEACRKYGIHMENSGSASGAHGMVYIAGISYLYEFDFGDLSGWVYHVNGIAPSVGCGEYELSDGDRIEWLYTLKLGEDVKEK